MTIRRSRVVATLALAIALAMGRGTLNGFVYDDAVAIVSNHHVTDPAQWHLIPTSTYWLGTLWRPVTVGAFAAQWWLFGGQAWGFHLVSLLAYLAVTRLLYELLRRLGASTSVSLAVCLLFAVHPLHVEAVANVVGQSELWVAMALIAATVAFLALADRAPALRDVVMIIGAVVVAILSKEQGFTAPILLLGAAWMLPATSTGTRNARARLLWLVTAVTILLLVVRSTVTGSLGGETPATAFAGTGPLARLVTFLDVIPRYACLLTWPMHLQGDYNPPQIPIGGAIGVQHVAGALILVAWIAMIWWCRRRAPEVAFGGWWLAVTLAPVSNLLAPTGIVMAERVLFLPSIGLAIALAGAVTALGAWRPSPMWRRALAAVAVAWGVVMLIRSAERTGVWHDQRRFFTQLTEDAPRSYRAWKVAAIYWQDAHQPDQAARAFRQSIALWPGDPDDYERLGQQLRAEGHCADAIPLFARGLTFDPTRTTLRAKLVECLIHQRRWDEAMQAAEEGVRIGQDAFAGEERRIRKFRSTDAQSH